MSATGFLRLAALVALAVAASVAVTIGAGRIVEGTAAHAAVAGALAFPLALAIAVFAARRTSAVLRAVEDGLLSLGERDYSVRIALTRQDEIGGLVRRFNELAAKLKLEHADVFQKEILLRTVVEAAPMAIVLVNEAGRVVLGNAAARELLLEGRALEGHPLGELADSLPPALRDAIGTREDTLITVDRSTGAETWHVSSRVFTLSTQSHTMHILRDLGRELDRQEAEAWKRVIRLISHELNNSLAPVTSLTHSARLLSQGPDAASKLVRVFDTIEERTRHLQTFLDSYARFARLPKPSRAEASWRSLLVGAEGLYPFRVHGEPPEKGWFDAAQMQQVLINLLKNAAESGSPADEITVEVARDVDGGAILRVCDRGKGMTDETLQKALLPFWSTKKSGTGLGLCLCREIVEAHGGRLAIHRREGGGIEVECRIPGR